MLELLRRNLLVILFAALIALQFMTWLEVSWLRDLIGHENVPCGDRYHPCQVIVVPEH